MSLIQDIMLGGWMDWTGWTRGNFQSSRLKDSSSLLCRSDHKFIIHGKHCCAQIEAAARKDFLYYSLYSSLTIVQERRTANVRQPTIIAPNKNLTVLTISPQNLPPSKEVIDTLNSIKTTPFAHSFLSRLRGFRGFAPPGLVAVDWETRTPWMNVMADIREHYLFAQSV
jgi:hypothetical protein